MYLESVIQSKLSQKKKDKFCVLRKTYGSQENGTDEPMSKAGIETRLREQTREHRGVKGSSMN